MVPDSMRAVVLPRYGGPEVLELRDWPTPRPRPDEVLVEVRAASVNPRDWLIRAGRYVFRRVLPKKPFVPGSDLSGVVVATGSRVRRFAVGDEILAMVPTSRGFGAHAQYATVPEGAVARKPQGLDFAHAAGMPLAGLTALQALRDDARLRPGQRVVVIGAVGGVGHFGVQIARAMGAREVLGVCRQENAELARSLGCNEVIDYRHQRWQDVVGEVDVVFDTIGKESLASCRRNLTACGHYVTSVPGPRQIREAVLTRLWPWGRQSRIALVLSRGKDLELLCQWVTEQKLRVVLDQAVDWREVATIHEVMRAFRTRGKNVLRFDLAQ